MGSGYVLNFSNRTFEEFIIDITGRSIYDGRYDYGSGSKANRLRGFWAAEANPGRWQADGESLSITELTLAPSRQTIPCSMYAAV